MSKKPLIMLVSYGGGLAIIGQEAMHAPSDTRVFGRDIRPAADERQRMAVSPSSSTSRLAHVRWPCFYGWVLVAVGFITMGVSVNARTAFSLLFPAILSEF